MSSTTHTENGVEKATEYAYNDAGQTVSITENPGNRVTSYTYDDMGNLTTEQRGMSEMQFSIWH